MPKPWKQPVDPRDAEKAGYGKDGYGEHPPDRDSQKAVSDHFTDWPEGDKDNQSNSK
jgi:hypothetical protein